MILDICQFKGVNNFVINPKAVTIYELMGKFDETSREWADGLLSYAIRNASNDHSGKEMLVTFDGPVEPDWVENINSVMDDNKRLNLVTGEIIYLTEAVKVLIETSDLTNTSPATVSRCAMIYFPREQLPIKVHFNTWLLNLPGVLADQKKRLDSYFNFFMPQIVENFLNCPSKLIYPVTGHWAVKTFVMLLDGMVAEYRNEKYKDERLMSKVQAKIESNAFEGASSYNSN